MESFVSCCYYKFDVICTIIITWLNCCKVFWWFYYADTKVIVFVWFHFLVCMNYIQLIFVLIFVLIILEGWLIVFLELIFWFQFQSFCIFHFWGFNFTLSAIFSSCYDFFYVSVHFNNVYYFINWTALF